MANVVRVGVETDGKMGVLFDATADFALEVVTQLDFEDRCSITASARSRRSPKSRRNPSSLECFREKFVDARRDSQFVAFISHRPIFPPAPRAGETALRALVPLLFVLVDCGFVIVAVADSRSECVEQIAPFRGG